MAIDYEKALEKARERDRQVSETLKKAGIEGRSGFNIGGDFTAAKPVAPSAPPVSPPDRSQEAGIPASVAPAPTDTFAPDTKSVLRGFYDTRNAMARQESQSVPITSINLAIVPHEKMDNTVRNTILAKAARQGIPAVTAGGAITVPQNVPAPVEDRSNILDTIGSGARRAGQAALGSLQNVSMDLASGANKILQLIDKHAKTIGAVRALDSIVNVADYISGAVSGKTISENLSNYEQKGRKIAEANLEKAYSGIGEGAGKWLLGGVEGVAAMAPTYALAIMSGGGSAVGGAILGSAGAAPTIASTVPSAIPGLSKQAFAEYASNFKSMTPFMIQAGAGYADQAEKEGYGLEQQIAYGMAGGFSEGITEMMAFGPLKKAFGLSENTLKPMLRKGIMDTVKHFGKKGIEWIDVAIANVAEEIAVNPLVGAAEKTILDPNKPLVGDEGILSLPEAKESSKGALAMSTILMMIGLPKNAVSFVTASRYIENGKIPSESETKKLLKIIEADLDENMDAISAAKDGAIFSELGLEEEYTPENVARMNMALYNKFEEAFRLLGKDDLSDNEVSTLTVARNILKEATNNDLVVDKAKPYYARLSAQIDDLLSQRANVTIESQIPSQESSEPVQPVSLTRPTEIPPQEESVSVEPAQTQAVHNVGKRQGNTLSVHKSAEPQSGVIEIAKKEVGDIDYDIIKLNNKTGAVTFIKVDDFDWETEPKVISETTITPDGEITTVTPQNKIIVDKASYVPEDYAGFDVAAAKAREKEWRDAKKYGPYDPKRIEEEDYFTERANKVFGNEETIEVVDNIGFILPNGKAFSLENYGEHYELANAIKADPSISQNINFDEIVDSGIMRIKPNVGVEISAEVEPSTEQYAKLERLIRNFTGEQFHVDFTLQGTPLDRLVYDILDIKTNKIIADIKKHYRVVEKAEKPVEAPTTTKTELDEQTPVTTHETGSETQIETQEGQRTDGEEKKTDRTGLKPNIGIHFGDLGKTEFLGPMSGTRGTGHFGTGTYFVTDPDAIKRMSENKDGNYGTRPRHEVSFEGYNLYVPKNEKQGMELHDFLQQVNKWAYDNERYRDSIADMYIASQKLFGAAFTSENELEEYLLKLRDYVVKNKEADWQAYFNKTKRYDSPSTVFMKHLGYEGVDVRGLKGLDNEKYGSVIYDLKKDNASGESVKMPVEENEIDTFEAPEYTVPEELRNAISGILGDLETKETRSIFDKMISDAFAEKDLADSFGIILNTLKGLEFTESISQDISADIKALKTYLRKVKIRITDDLRNNIPDFNDFRKRNLLILRLTNDGTYMDTVYDGLSDLWPEYFSKDVTHPADQLQLIVEVVRGLKTGESYRLGDRLTDQEIADYYATPIFQEIYNYRRGNVTNGRKLERRQGVYEGAGRDGTAADNRQGEVVAPVGIGAEEATGIKDEDGKTFKQEMRTENAYVNIMINENGYYTLVRTTETPFFLGDFDTAEEALRFANKHKNTIHKYSPPQNRDIDDEDDPLSDAIFDDYVEYERSKVKKVSLATLLENIDYLRRADLESLGEQISAGNWDYEEEDLTDDEFRSIIKERIQEQISEISQLEAQAPKYGYYVRPPKMPTKAEAGKRPVVETKKRARTDSGDLPDQYSRGSGTSAANQEFAGQISASTGQNFAGKTEAILRSIPKNYKAKTINAIKASIMKNFGVNIYSKNFRRPDGVYAYFRPTHNIIATRYHQALGVVVHELGHKLDKEYGFKDTEAIKQILNNTPDYRASLESRGYKEDAMPGEVVADFVMMYLTNPNAAFEAGSYARGRNFYDVFEGILSKKDLNNIRGLQRDILAWGTQDSISKARKTIVYRGDKKFPSIKNMADMFMRSWIDGFYGAQQFIKAVNRASGNDVKATDDTYEMLRKTLAAPSITSAIIEDAMIDPQGFPAGRSFSSILKNIKRLDFPLFDLYLKDVHSLDWMATGKRVYSIEMDSADEIRARIATLESEHPEFRETAEELYDWWKKFTDMWLVGTGLKTQEFMDKIHDMYPHYVPNFRQVEGIRGQNASVGGDPIKRASQKGSDLPTYSAIENFILLIGNVVKAGVENQAMTTLHTLYNNKEFSETVGLFLAQIPPDLRVNQFNSINLKKALTVEMFKEAWEKMTPDERNAFNNLPLEDQIVAASAMSNAQIIDDVIADSITYFTAKSESSDPNTVVAMIKGKPKFYYITDESLARAFMALQPKQMGGILRMIKALTRAQTGVTTANNIFFAIANHARDIQHGLVMTKSKYHALDPRTYLGYFKDLLIAYGEIVSHTRIARRLGIRPSEIYSLYKANAGLASKYMPQGDAFNKVIREIKGVRAVHKDTKAGNIATTAKNVVAAAFDLISAFNGVIEAAPRMVAFRRTFESEGRTPEALVKAVHAAKEATVDFWRRGTVTANLATAVPFVGASIAGIDQFRRITMSKEAWTTKEGRQRLIRAVLSQAIPAIIMALIYVDDDDWNNLQDYIKDGYWLFKYDDDKFIKVPKEREISAVFGTSFQRAVLNYLQPDLDNEDELASYIKYVLETFTPAHYVTGWAIFQAINNKAWYGGSIVPERDEALMQPEYYDEIYDETTSKLAVLLAKSLPDAEVLGALNTPKGIEYAIDQLSGGIGDILLPATTPSTAGANELLRRYMTDSVYSNKYSNEAYDILDELDAAVEYGKRANIEDEKAEVWQKAFANTLYGQSEKYITISDYFKQIRDNNNDLSITAEEREERNRKLRENINRIAEKLVNAYKEGGDPPYSFADVAIDEGAKAYGITDKQYSDAINAIAGKKTVSQKYALATLPGLSDEQKAYISESVLHNKSFEEWGPVYRTLSEYTDAENLEALNDSLKDIRSDTYTTPKGEEVPITAGSGQERRGDGKSASLKKKEAIDKAYPNASKEFREALYKAFEVSEKVWD